MTNIKFNKYRILLLVASGLIGLIGCSTVDMPPSTSPPIVLKEVQTRSIVVGLITPGTITFPTGIYEPVFQTKEGIYYLSQKKLIQKAVGIHEAKPGGIFLPYASASDQRHGYWIDETDRWSPLAASINHQTRIYRFGEPLKYETQSSSKQ